LLKSARPVRSQCGIESIPQGYITKRLEKALGRALLDEAPPDGLICASGDEHNWNLLPAKRQFAL
jgi:hypothetical protein